MINNQSTNRKRKKVKLSRPILGYNQPIVELCGQKGQGKTGISLSAIALNPEFAGLPGCPEHFLKLFNITNPSHGPDEPALRRIIPITQVNVVDDEKDVGRLLLYFRENEIFTDEAILRVMKQETYEDDEEYDIEEATEIVQEFSKDRDIQTRKDFCNVYDTFSRFLKNLNDQQKIVSRKHAEEDWNRKKKAGSDNITRPAILGEDELARVPQQTDWQWRNTELGEFVKATKGFSSMTVLNTRMKKLYNEHGAWDKKTWVPQSHEDLEYHDDVRLFLTERRSDTILVTIDKNRLGPACQGEQRRIKLSMWSMAEILLWLYGFGEDNPPVNKITRLKVPAKPAKLATPVPETKKAPSKPAKATAKPSKRPDWGQ